MPSAEDVDVKMIDGLASIWSGVYDEAVAALQPGGPRKLGGYRHKPPQQLGVVLAGGGVGFDVGFGDEQQVDGRLRVDVRERKRVLVFVDSPGWNLPAHDFAEYAIHCHIGRVYLTGGAVAQRWRHLSEQVISSRPTRSCSGSGRLESVRNRDNSSEGECA